jgi:hypothetical protein
MSNELVRMLSISHLHIARTIEIDLSNYNQAIFANEGSFLMKHGSPSGSPSPKSSKNRSIRTNED